MQQVLEANKLIKPSTRDGARPSEVRFARCTDAPRGGSKGKQVDSYIEIESLSDSKIVATGRQKKYHQVVPTPALIFLRPLMPSETEKMGICGQSYFPEQH